MNNAITQNKITVIGAGLAGVEAANIIAKQGVAVDLYEMKKVKKSLAHHNDMFAELVCSNSLKSNSLDNACGLLKEEMRRMGSLTMEAAEYAKVPAGSALAVDRDKFSEYITKKIYENPLINVIDEEVKSIDFDSIVIVATGPLTSEELSSDIKKYVGEGLSFYDAASPIVTNESIDYSRAFMAARYDKGTKDYVNCEMTKEEYETFYYELINAQTAELKDFEKDVRVFEGCMPIEQLAKRGEKTLLFGPLKPAGLTDPKTGRWPYAVVQLRKENTQSSLYNLVGFQTNLKFSEQKRVFSLIPALKNAEFVRYGVMHKNTFIDSPRLLDCYYRLKENKNIFFAGQITGVEGYVESANSGMIAGINAAKMLKGEKLLDLSKNTASGALINYITTENKNFQPMNINFGIMPALDVFIKDKKERYLQIAKRALDEIDKAAKLINGN